MNLASLASLKDGISKFQHVDEGLYRGAQPTLPCYRWLADIGLSLVVNLRDDPLPMEPQAVHDAGLRYENHPMNGFRRPHELAVQSTLDSIVREIDRKQGVYVHCEHGNDRTGLIIAVYRIAHCGWTNRQALAEAEADGMAWEELPFKEFVEDYSHA